MLGANLTAIQKRIRAALCVYMDKGTKILRPFDLLKLFTKTEFLYDCTVAFDILLLEVVEKVSSLTNHFVHTAAAVVVVVVVFQVPLLHRRQY